MLDHYRGAVSCWSSGQRKQLLLRRVACACRGGRWSRRRGEEPSSSAFVSGDGTVRQVEVGSGLDRAPPHWACVVFCGIAVSGVWQDGVRGMPPYFDAPGREGWNLVLLMAGLLFVRANAFLRYPPSNTEGTDRTAMCTVHVDILKGPGCQTARAASLKHLQSPLFPLYQTTTCLEVDTSYI